MLVRVHGTGVLILGAAGSGKSALALELVSRGHQLVADDAVELRAANNRLTGQCPRALRGLLEVRGLGILDLRRLYGARFVRMQSQIHLVLKLKPGVIAFDRLRGNYRPLRLQGVVLPCLSLPTSLGHNLAVYTETACLQLRWTGRPSAATRHGRRAGSRRR